MKKVLLLVLLAFLLAACSSSDDDDDTQTTPPVVDDGLPILVPGDAYSEIPLSFNQISSDQLYGVFEGEEGLEIDLEDPAIWGEIYVSQYPFEAQDSAYDYAYYIDKIGDISEGTGLLPLSHFLDPKYDANEWLADDPPAATPTAAYRLELFKADAEEPYIGMYGGFVSFDMTDDGALTKMPSVIDGPYVTLVSSDDPTSMEIVWETDEPCSGKVFFGTEAYDEGSGEITRHAVKVSGLSPDADYQYRVESVSADGRKTVSDTYDVRTAPEKGQGDVAFAFGSDSRTGKVGGGERSYMGINLYVLQQMMTSAYVQGADFFVFGGDLIYGGTSVTDDYALQLKAWKQGAAGFWRSRPIYAGMGNHEFGMNYFMGEGEFLGIDKWPYETDSGEAVFAAELFNPMNGPAVSDARRPTYDENVFHFQYGPVKVISFNNTYWISSSGYGSWVNDICGGAPLGYLMEDQLAWIERTIADAENDPTVKFIFLFTHSPVFPAMTHVKDAMWWNGDNNIRAYTKNKETGALEPDTLGMVEVRNRLWKSLAQSSKVAAVFTGDEHAYHRTLIDSSTPVGVYPDDDTDGDGVLDKYSPNPEFTNPVWHVTCGGGGAPYVAEKGDPPWTPEVLNSNTGYVMIRTNGDKASLEFFGNPSGAAGELLDKVDDLTAVK